MKATSPQLCRRNRDRLISHMFLENIVVNPGTNIIWLNGDVGHEHTITLIDENSGKVYDSGKFDFNTVSKPLVLNKTGKFAYSEATSMLMTPSS